MKNWIDEFYKLYFECNDIKDFSKALEIKRNNIPNVLYRYRKVNDYLVDEILQEYVYLSPPTDFNDVLDTVSNLTLESLLASDRLKEEYQGQFKEKFSGQKLKEIFNSEDWFKVLIREILKKEDSKDIIKDTDIVISAIEKQTNELNKSLTDLARKMLKIACFTIDNVNTAMWSHYADDNKGVCVAYDIKNCFKLPFLHNRLYPIRYVKELPDCLPLLNRKSYGLMEFIAMHKTRHWEYENEWRLILSLGDYFFSKDEVKEIDYREGKKCHFAPVKEVYLGININKGDKNKILDLAKQKKFNVFQMKLEKSKMRWDMIYESKKE